MRIAVAESVTTRLLPDAIADYQGRHPGIAFAVTVDGPERLLALLLEDAVDLIFTHSPIRDRAIEVLASAAQPLCALVAAEHPLAGRKGVRLHDCVAYPIAMPDETLAARAFLDACAATSAVDHARTRRWSPTSVETHSRSSRAPARECVSHFTSDTKPMPRGWWRFRCRIPCSPIPGSSSRAGEVGSCRWRPRRSPKRCARSSRRSGASRRAMPASPAASASALI